MSDFWLILYPDTFLWDKGDKGMFYNSANGKNFKYHVTEDLKAIVESLKDPFNHYSVLISTDELADDGIHRWADNIVAMKGGEIRFSGEYFPISFAPKLKMREKYYDTPDDYVKHYKKDVLGNLSELVLYINGNLKYDRLKYKQFIHPIDSDKTLPFEEIKNMIYECRGGHLSMVAIVGDVFDYQYFQELLDWIDRTDLTITLHTTISHLNENRNQIGLINKCDGVNVVVIIDELSLIEDNAEALKEIGAHSRFIVTSEDDYDDVVVAVTARGMEDFDMVPFYTGRNMEFFERNVFNEYDDIVGTHLTKREIFARQTLNTNFYGRLIVLPDGYVYANTNNEPLGKLGDNLFDMLFKELSSNESWLKVRDSQPCTDCLCQYLCPSISNYEIVTGRVNMCDKI